MTSKRFKKLIALSLACSMGASYLTPAAAFATQNHIRLDNHASPEATTELSRLKIDQVSAPRTDSKLDGNAIVSSAEGKSWIIPVLWVDSDLQIATQAVADKTYLPVLVFYLPDGYAAQQTDMAGGFAVELSESLIPLFDGQDAIAIYEEETELTFILPVSLRSYFGGVPSGTGLGGGEPSFAEEGRTLADAIRADLVVSTTDGVPTPASQLPTPAADGRGSNVIDPSSSDRRLVDVYCSPIVSDLLSREDLDFLVDLVVKKLQPTALEQLRAEHPDFDAATAEDALAGQVGLFFYYGGGDFDSMTAAFNLFSDSDLETFDLTRYGYLIDVDVSTSVRLSEDGGWHIAREDDSFTVLEDDITNRLYESFSLIYGRDRLSAASLSDILAGSAKSALGYERSGQGSYTAAADATYLGTSAGTSSQTASTAVPYGPSSDDASTNGNTSAGSSGGSSSETAASASGASSQAKTDPASPVAGPSQTPAQPKDGTPAPSAPEQGVAQTSGAKPTEQQPAADPAADVTPASPSSIAEDIDAVAQEPVADEPDLDEDTLDTDEASELVASEFDGAAADEETISAE